MSRHIDDILGIIDGGLQRSTELAQYIGNTAMCVHCQARPVEPKSDWCKWCHPAYVAPADPIETARAEDREALERGLPAGWTVEDFVGRVAAALTSVGSWFTEAAPDAVAASQAMAELAEAYDDEEDWEEPEVTILAMGVNDWSTGSVPGPHTVRIVPDDETRRLWAQAIGTANHHVRLFTSEQYRQHLDQRAANNMPITWTRATSDPDDPSGSL